MLLALTRALVLLLSVGFLTLLHPQQSNYPISYMTYALVAPACVAGFSAILLGRRGFVLSSKQATASPQTQTVEPRYGAVFAWNILRLIGCITLFGLSVASLAIHSGEHDLLYARVCMSITFVSHCIAFKVACLLI